MHIQRENVLTRHKIWLVAGALLAVTTLILYVWHSQQSADISSDADEAASTVVDADDEAEATLRPIVSQPPVRIKIAAINVDAPIVPVGTEPDGAMSAPKTATDIGWYERSATLGTVKRAVLLSGHYGLDIPEVLRRLNELKEGDSIALEGAAGDVVTYTVVETERQHRTKVDMEKAFNYGEGKEATSIITCIGEYDYAAGTYSDRYIVYAVRNS